MKQNNPWAIHSGSQIVNLTMVEIMVSLFHFSFLNHKVILYFPEVISSLHPDLDPTQ